MFRFTAKPWLVGLWVLFRLPKILIFAALISLPSMAVQAEDAKVSLLDSSGNAKRLSAETVREIFFMRLSSWPDGSPIHVFVLPDDHPLHVRFAKEILGVYPFQLRSAWDRLVFSGTGVSPTTVESLEEMRSRIASTPGAIGYTDKK
ncbi:hypothetical protein [Methylomicrobium lacus]|uniref:hypothetical protein n=1 Tax=Methylomicrobium lacus TaxID=136992 RepID=UPI0035A85E67